LMGGQELVPCLLRQKCISRLYFIYIPIS
jgi:hypothetical protein